MDDMNQQWGISRRCPYCNSSRIAVSDRDCDNWEPGDAGSVTAACRECKRAWAQNFGIVDVCSVDLEEGEIQWILDTGM